MMPLYAVTKYLSKKMLIPPEGGGLLLEKYSGNVRNQKFKVVRACVWCVCV
jgi:hypothetical protein